MKCTVFALVVIGLVFSTVSQTLAQPMPEHRATAEVRYDSQQSLGQAVTLAEMSNGLTVIVRENHAAPVATVRCYVQNTGSVYEGKYLGTGVSHMLEHLVAGGTTEKRSEKEIQELVDSLGGRTNAFTSTSMTGYYIDCPSNRVDLAIDLVAEEMQFAVIPQDEYLREMGVVQRELEMGKADRNRVRYYAMSALLFTQHPMRHPIIGYLPVVQQVTRDDVIAFYKDRYVPQNMVFVVVGDVKTEEILDRVLHNFKDFQRTTERIAVLPEEPDQASPRSTRIEMEGETSILSIGWPTVPLQHPDLYPLDVASYLLTNGDSSRLAKKLKIEQPLAVSVDSSSYTPGFVKGWFEVNVECAPDKVEQCRKIAIAEIQRLKKELVSEKELAKVKRQKAAEHVFSQQTVQSQADSLGRSFISAGDPLFDDQYVKGIQSVTPEQVRDVMRKYFRPERENRVLIEPIGSGPDAAGEEVAESVESEVIRKKLDNGLTVLVKRHAVVPMVSIQAFVKAGVLADTPETSGRSALASSMMSRGTEKYTGDEIAEYFDSIGGALETDSQRNTSYLQCQILKDDFETAFDYVHQVLLKPTFPEDEFEKVQQLQLGRIAQRKANPQTEILDFFNHQLPKDNPFSRTVLGTKETVAKLTAQDCREFHQQHFVPNNMVLAIYGDIDTEQALQMVENSFGKVPAGLDPLPSYEEEHSISEDVTAHLTTQREDTAMLVIGYPASSVFDEKTRSVLEIVSTVLTGGRGAGGRLFNELRGERLVYYVFGFQLTGLPPGYFLFMAQTRPETVDEVVSRIRAVVDEIRTEGIPEDEFRRAKEKLIAGHALENTTPASQAFQAAIDELYGLGYDHDRGFDDRINAVTVEDVKEVLNKHFRGAYIVTSSPVAIPKSASKPAP